MEVIDPDKINEDLTKKSLEVLHLVFKTINERLKNMVPDTNYLSEMSGEIIGLLAVAEYLSHSVPKEIHNDIWHRARHLSQFLLTKFPPSSQYTTSKLPPAQA